MIGIGNDERISSHVDFKPIFISDKIRPLRGHLPFITTISFDEFGFDVNKNSEPTSGNF